ncbi:MAG: bifunctional 4-hydroxy-2-oxoglutarate aldolase/2-dehydro-3-deoxy-phosphogluconate aldolase [Neisseriaceae bacterium]|jgi:2-dehydro-3-deoxyphosphogluconate aldolase/(4S)-4-hydroxy-2-oxoglutarate aldolase
MNKKLTCEAIFAQNKIIPVVVLNDVNKAIPLAHALQDGGINIMEITLRTPNALQIIEKIHNSVSNIIVGAGTILTEDQYHTAIKHGAQFLVSPGLNNALINVKSDYTVPFIPGAITPTEVLCAYNAGFKYLKFFPAESYNGPSALKSLASVFPDIKFCPTGGINLDNIERYLSLPNIAGIGCSFVVTEELITTSNYAQITKLARQVNALTK